jgi:hypothetical protein
MKKVVKCVQDLFAYFNALETNSVEAKPKKERLEIKLTVHSLKSRQNKKGQILMEYTVY